MYENRLDIFKSKPFLISGDENTAKRLENEFSINLTSIRFEHVESRQSNETSRLW